MGPKASEQCAGFMRIQGGKNPLDATSVHPESYEAAEKLLEKQGFTTKDITGGNLQGLSKSTSKIINSLQKNSASEKLRCAIL